MHNFNSYASLKTTGQLVMDLGSVTSHIVALVSLLRISHDEPPIALLKWFLVGTIIFQVVIAIGLYIFRLLDYNHEVNRSRAHTWNIVFFIALVIIALLESFIAIYEKFGLDHGPIGSNNCTVAVHSRSLL